jgi:hypothetical protein
MAKDHRLLHNVGANTPLYIVMDIATADSSVVDSDGNIVWGFNFGLGFLLEIDIEGLVENKGEVLRLELAELLAWRGKLHTLSVILPAAIRGISE